MLSVSFSEFSVDIGAFVVGLSKISSFSFSRCSSLWFPGYNEHNNSGTLMLRTRRYCTSSITSI